MSENVEIRPQGGPQTRFLETTADIAIYGGAAGGGKTHGLLLESLRNIHNARYQCTIFRRTTPEIKMQGGLWDSAGELYPLVGARGMMHRLAWVFPSGAKIEFRHFEHDKTRYKYQGLQSPVLMYDELTHFSAAQFWYMLSRNRSVSGVRPYIRGATNPDPDSWVREFIDWWIGEDGYPIPDRDGHIRWFVRKRDTLHWADTKEELEAKWGKWDPVKKTGCLPKSVTFIKADIYDNPALLDKNPEYLANLEALTLVEREQLLKGNWNIRAAAGLIFRREWFERVKACPADAIGDVRYWDRAATPKTATNDPDATAGLRLSRDRKGVFYIRHVKRMWETAFKVDTAILHWAKEDGLGTTIGFMQDPGSAGKGEAEATARMLAGYHSQYAPATGDKPTRARSASSQAQAGNIKIVDDGTWDVEAFLRELENFPTEEGKGHDDQVDALSGAMEIILGRGSNIPAVRPGAGRPTEKPRDYSMRPKKQRHASITM